jgi:hypothetical protein
MILIKLNRLFFQNNYYKLYQKKIMNSKEKNYFEDFKVSNIKKAKITGLLYLGVVLIGTLSLIYVPSNVIIWNNSNKNYNNFNVNQMLFQIGIISGLICCISFLLLPLVLYKLLKPIIDTYAKLLVLFGVLSATIGISLLVKMSEF